MSEPTRGPIDWVELDARLAAADLDGALDLALAAWRACRHSLLADVVDAIASQIVPVALDERTHHRAWLALAAAATPRDMATLVAGLRKRLPKPRPETNASGGAVPLGWLERFAALAALPADPRFARPVLDIVRATPWFVSNAHQDAVYYTPLRFVVGLRDLRIRAALDELGAAVTEGRVRWRLSLAEHVLLARMEMASWTEPPLADDDAARARAIIARFADRARRASAARAGELLAMIRKDPDDDGAREVYADTLIELGDPAGEFFTLQLAAAREGDLATAGRMRARTLLRMNLASWIGEDLDTVLKSIVFERGLLAEAELEHNAVTIPAIWQRAAHDERLATIHTLRKGRGNERHYSAFVFSPAMTGLREVTLLSRKMIERVLAAPATEPWPFRHLVLEKAPSVAQLDAVLDAPGLPELVAVTVACAPDNATALPAFVRLARARGLETVYFNDRYGHWPELVAALAGLLADADPGALALGVNEDQRYRFTRGERGLVAEITLANSYFDAAILTELPPLERVVIREREHPGRTTVGADADITKESRFGALLEALAPFHPELPSRWPADAD